MATKPIKVEDLPLFDPVDYLDSEEAIQAFLADAEQDIDPRQLAIAQSHVERARKRWGQPSPADPVAMKADELPNFDVANYLDDEEQIRLYLEEVAKENHEEMWSKALDDVARARKRWNLPAPRITLGMMKGRIELAEDFDAPLTDEELRANEGNLPPTS